MSSTEIKSDDNGYKDVQAKLTRLTKALDDKAVELEVLRRGMQANAMKAEDTAKAIEDADLDPRFVEATFAVSSALGGAAVQLRHLIEDAAEGASHSRVVQRTHARFYSGLDEVRSNRPEKTPKPGFLVE
ncbi:conjugal transfer protein TraB [Streptomyces sp. SR27]|uniref:conjugal transfer protein TraB n=1 Tax=Streptomyces sp. SR27 TaxID=3076630 RepID=UPI00295BCF31|nr:conjugal transfer protein TraB [Streptomyces sp. SR27]MDV9188186.1 conjugal transfer protein TraB [Streptomyces sp. SR27]